MMSIWLQVVRKLAYEPRLNSTDLKHVQSDRLILPSRLQTRGMIVPELLQNFKHRVHLLRGLLRIK